MTYTILQTTQVQELSDQDLEQINGGWFFLPFLVKAAVKAVKVAKIAAKIAKAYVPGNNATATSQVVQHITKAGVGIRMNGATSA